MSVGMVMYWGFLYVLPTLACISYVINTDKIELIDVITPFSSLSLITVYNDDKTIILILNLIMLIIFTITSILTAIWVLLLTCSLIYICFELELLSDIIENMDNVIDKLNIKNENSFIKNLFKKETKLSDLKWKHFLRNIHRHHLIIIIFTEDYFLFR